MCVVSEKGDLRLVLTLCYNLEPCVRDFRIYITRSRLRNTMLRGPIIYTCTNMCYVRGRHK